MNVLVRDGYIGLTDKDVALLGIAFDVRHARHRIRDDGNRITWVYDRLQGLTPADFLGLPGVVFG